ncbi:MAG: methyltransferase domain-containing protein [Corynebacterium sp.]|nr:methyltransferase domain-containing protein [Corynebacterium sp.]
MLSDVLNVLADPTDGSALEAHNDGAILRSATGNSYVVSPDGYVVLAGNGGLRYTGDDYSMIAAREVFLSRGHYAPFVEAVTDAVGDALDEAERLGHTIADNPVITEIGAGTGYYLSHNLDSIQGSRGVGIDVSVHAAKHLSQCHPRAGAVVADAWARLPLLDNSVDAITVVFSPRNAAEFARVLKPGGEVVVLTATRGHLAELREPLGILDVEEGRVERMIAQAASHLEPVKDPELVEFSMNLDQLSIAEQIGMSPSARHIHPDVLNQRIAALPTHMEVTARATLTRLRVKA